MAEFFHSVRLDTELCQGCINCIKRCPTEAIRLRNRKAVILPVNLLYSSIDSATTSPTFKFSSTVCKPIVSSFT
ncbi:MAG: 4Fe-4S binding protein, partial [Oscillospiraceae bacterium]|nr:4Fe-4S binding protein [Oscillospiraceae bacterium]